MRRSVIGLACAMGVVFAGPPASARADGEDAWVLVSAPNGAFSIETPCSESEVAALQGVPGSAVPNVEIVPQSRVICRKGPLIFLAGVVEPRDYPASGPSLFDLIVEAVAQAPAVEGKPTTTTIGGRRAFVNREERDGVLAQTGFIELGRAKAIMLVAGFDDASVSVAAQGEAIDHFYASTKVTAR